MAASNKKVSVKKVNTGKKVSRKMTEAQKAPQKSATAMMKAKKADKKAPASGTKNVARKKLGAKAAAAKKGAPKSGARKAPSRATTKFVISDDSLVHGIAPYRGRKNEKFMSARQMTHFKKILLAWRANLIEGVSRTIHNMQDETINHPDPNDRASQETDMSLELRNRDRERKLLKKIDDTVARVDSHDYGWCESCGVEIGIKRLEARPTAELCVDCKTLNEIKEKQMV